MITTVCLNPAFDKTTEVEHFQASCTNRAECTRIDPGGKGINVALVLQKLGSDAQCISCLGKEHQADFMALLLKTGLKHDYLSVEGIVRTNLKIVDRSAQAVTELNESGTALTEQDLLLFRDMLIEQTQENEFVVLAGSIPKGTPNHAYRMLMQALPNRKCVLDSSGEAFLAALSEKPFLIKPNQAEVEWVLKKKLHSLQDVRDAGLRLIKAGAQHVVISMGKEGAMLIRPEGSYYSEALPVEVKSTVGAGDSMLAGMLHALSQGAGFADAFRSGLAAASAAVMTEGTQPFAPESYEALLPKVRLQKL